MPDGGGLCQAHCVVRLPVSGFVQPLRMAAET